MYHISINIQDACFLSHSLTDMIHVHLLISKQRVGHSESEDLFLVLTSVKTRFASAPLSVFAPSLCVLQRLVFNNFCIFANPSCRLELPRVLWRYAEEGARELHYFCTVQKTTHDQYRAYRPYRHRNPQPFPRNVRPFLTFPSNCQTVTPELTQSLIIRYSLA